MELEKTREIANVRIHVELVIGSLRQKYQIVEVKLPISVLCADLYSDNMLDEILIVCSALFNLYSPIIVTLRFQPCYKNA